VNPASLTPRERQVAYRVAQGYRAREIARDLGIAETTVRFYINRIAESVPGRGRPMVRIATWWVESRGEL
jgi:FixJ family two-component response regulator